MIEENIRRLLAEIPEGVEVVAAAKTRSAEEISEASLARVQQVFEDSRSNRTGLGWIYQRTIQCS